MTKIDFPPLSQFTFDQKLYLMEKLWDDLLEREPAPESPLWHEVILKDREQALAAGNVSGSDWAEAKKRIRKNVS